MTHGGQLELDGVDYRPLPLRMRSTSLHDAGGLAPSDQCAVWRTPRLSGRLVIGVGGLLWPERGPKSVLICSLHCQQRARLFRHLRRRFIDLGDQLLQFLTGHRIDLQLCLAGVSDEFRVGHSVHEGPA